MNKFITKEEDKNISQYEGLSPKHRLFVDNLIKCNFNATRAYMRTYPDSGYETAASSASALIRNPKVDQALAERCAELEVFEKLTPELLMREVWELYRSARQEGTKSRLLELIFKAKGLLKDTNTTQVAIFHGVTDKEISKLYEKRKQIIDVSNPQPEDKPPQDVGGCGDGVQGGES